MTWPRSWNASRQAVPDGDPSSSAMPFVRHYGSLKNRPPPRHINFDRIPVETLTSMPLCGSRGPSPDELAGPDEAI